ncbi:MAG: Rho termination factor N-terminal domain-containing protein, partial [Desulfurivibrionaceae bacterium]
AILAGSSVAELMELELFDEKIAESLIKAAAEVPAPGREEAGGEEAGREEAGREEASGEEREAVVEDQGAERADLAGKTNAELREMCAAAGITGVSKKTKDELLAVLRDAESAGGGDEGEAAD